LWTSCGVELAVRVLVQVGEHLVAQPAGPGGRGLPAADRGLERPPRLGGLLGDLIQARQRRARCSCARPTYKLNVEIM
jgi:hypothetical protein